MAQDTRSNIKSHFEAGDIPSEGNYVDLIDSFVSIKDHNSGSIVISGSLSSTEGLNISSSITASVISASGTGHILGGDTTLIRDLTVGNAISGLNLSISNEITASGNISSSATILADVYKTNGVSALRWTGTGLKISDGSSPIELQGPVSAIGNISSSLISTGSFGRLESHTIGGLSPVTITDDTTVLGNITGSSISASGTLLGNSLNLGGTAVTATATEINKLDGLTISKAELNYLDGITNTNALVVKGLNQYLATTSDVTFGSVSITKLELDNAGDFDGSVTTEGRACHFTVRNIPEIFANGTGKNSSEAFYVRNPVVGTNSTILITCTSDKLVANAFGNNTGGAEGFFMNLTNMDVENSFLITSASFSLVIL